MSHAGLALFIGGCLVVVVGLFRHGRFSAQRAITFLLVASILLPAIAVLESAPAIRWEIVVACVVWLLLIAGSWITGQPLVVGRDSVHKWFILFGMVVVTSMIYAAIGTGYHPVGRDYWEIAKPFMYLALFTLVSSMRISVSAFKRCYWTLVSILLVSASFGWAQYWNLLDINTRIVPHYTTSQLVNLGGWSRRIVGTTGNPNSFAALMILAASLALAGALWLKGRGARLVLWAGFGVFVFTLVLTSSRSGLMGLVLACGVILFVKYPAHFRARGVARALFVFVPVLALTLVTIAPLLPAGFRFRMADALRPQASAGLQERFVRWQTHLDLWRESPVVGLGPAKGVISTNVDNEFLLVLARYGVVGLAVFLFLCVGLYACVTRLRRNTLTTEATALVVALEAVFLAYVVFMLLAGVYHDMQLMSIVLIVLGLARTQQTSMQRRSK